MRRIILREVPEDLYTALAEGAVSNRQSLNAFVVERLTEGARVLTISDYVHGYEPPHGTGVTVDDAVAALRAVHEPS